MTKALQTHVRRCAKAAPNKEIAEALGKLVKARLSKPKPRRLVAEYTSFDLARDAIRTAPPKVRRSARRRGRNQSYRATGKPDISRLGTFRHYMLQVICRHESTWAAESEHALCDNPKFAKNRLDFSWAAAEGYIEFV